MKKVYFVTHKLIHKKSKTLLDRSESSIKEFSEIEPARELFNDLVSIYGVYFGRDDYKLYIKLFEPLRLRSTGKLTTIEGRKIDEFSFVGDFFKKDKDIEDIIVQTEE